MRKPLKVLLSDGAINESADLRAFSIGGRCLLVARRYARASRTFQLTSLPCLSVNPYLESLDRAASDQKSGVHG